MSLITKNQITIIQVSDGAPGDPGTPGIDGVSLVTWVRYADNPDGSGGMYTDPIGRAFIGRAYNKNPNDPVSTDPADYTWEPFFMAVVASDLEIIAGGQLRSGYDAQGNPPSSGSGFFLGSDGKLKARDGEFSGELISARGIFGCISHRIIDISPDSYPKVFTASSTSGDIISFFTNHLVYGETCPVEIAYQGQDIRKCVVIDYGAYQGIQLLTADYVVVLNVNNQTPSSTPLAGDMQIDAISSLPQIISDVVPMHDLKYSLGSPSRKLIGIYTHNLSAENILANSYEGNVNAPYSMNYDLYGRFHGDLTGNVTGDLTGDVTGNVNAQGTSKRVWGAVAN